MVSYTLEPSQTNTAYTPDQLIAGSHEMVTDTVTVAAGQVLTRGALLGQQTAGVFPVVSTPQTTSGGANTGNGTIGAVTAGARFMLGTYRVTMTSATAFTVYDPTGDQVGTGAAGVAFTGPQVGFTITAGGTAFVANDGFNLAVEAATGSGAGQYVLATAAANDGSQLPSNWVILAEDTNTSSTGTNAATLAPVYTAGEFDANFLTLGAGLNAAGVKLGLRQEGTSLYIKTTAFIAASL